MEDGSNRIVTAALDYSFSLHWSCTQVLKGIRSPSSCQLLQQPVVPIGLLRGCGFTLHDILPSRVFLITGCGPFAAFTPLMGAREG